MSGCLCHSLDAALVQRGPSSVRLELPFQVCDTLTGTGGVSGLSRAYMMLCPAQGGFGNRKGTERSCHGQGSRVIRAKTFLFNVKVTDHARSPPCDPSGSGVDTGAENPISRDSQLCLLQPLARGAVLPWRAAWTMTENLNVLSVDMVWRLQHGQLTGVLCPGGQLASPPVWPGDPHAPAALASDFPRHASLSSVCGADAHRADGGRKHPLTGRTAGLGEGLETVFVSWTGRLRPSVGGPVPQGPWGPFGAGARPHVRAVTWLVHMPTPPQWGSGYDPNPGTEFSHCCALHGPAAPGKDLLRSSDFILKEGRNPSKDTDKGARDKLLKVV